MRPRTKSAEFTKDSLSGPVFVPFVNFVRGTL